MRFVSKPRKNPKVIIHFLFLTFNTNYMLIYTRSHSLATHALFLFSFFLSFCLFLALAQHVCHLQSMRTFWNKWRSSLHHKRREEDCLLTATNFDTEATQRRAPDHWSACIQNIKKYFWIHIDCNIFTQCRSSKRYQHSCLLLEFISRCGIVQTKEWKKRDCKAKLPSSSTGEIFKQLNDLA